MTAKRRKVGRPPASDPRTRRLGLSLTEGEWARLVAERKRRGFGSMAGLGVELMVERLDELEAVDDYESRFQAGREAYRAGESFDWAQGIWWCEGWKEAEIAQIEFNEAHSAWLDTQD